MFVFFIVFFAVWSFWNTAFSQDTYDPISPDLPIESLQKGRVPSLGEYLNEIFTFTLAIAALLAVIRITMGGITYMTSSSGGATGEARETIKSAVLGLLVILATYLILNQINPDILRFDIGGREVNEITK